MERYDLAVVIRNAFQAVRRELQELVEKQRGDTKSHPHQEPSGFVTRLFPEEGYGFIQGIDGREFYFHRNSVLYNDFDELEVGIGVALEEETGEKGPQASTVRIIDNRGERREDGELAS